MFQFLCVVTYSCGVNNVPRHCFSFFVLLRSSNVSSGSFMLQFQFLCVVTLLVMSYVNLVKCFSFFVLLLTNLAPRERSVDVVLVSLCCYFSLLPPRLLLRLVFQFLCVVTALLHRHYFQHVIVLVSLCCYPAKLRDPFRSFQFQFLCVVTYSIS